MELTVAAAPFKPVFEFFCSEEANETDPPFADQLLENWFIEDEDGKREEIGMPEIKGKDIFWRFIGAHQ
ncbi:hypothetical protein BH10CYA1_BH10CYA1_03330 [soil metagenome]